VSPAPVTRQEVARRILSGATARALGDGAAFAPANIALCKYWGKRNEELNLPVTSSLSVSLGEFGSKVALKPGGSSDQFALNGETLAPDSPFARRAASFLDLFRPAPRFGFAVSAENTIPTAAGFASSASGFAALTLALNRLFGWQLDGRSLSAAAAPPAPCSTGLSNGTRDRPTTAWTAMPSGCPKRGRNCAWACW
jgi:diphosphomevalonate decarboxylase